MVLDYLDIQNDAISSVYIECGNFAGRLLVLIFLVVTFRIPCAVPDAWRLWADPKSAYCCG